MYWKQNVQENETKANVGNAAGVDSHTEAMYHLGTNVYGKKQLRPEGNGRKSGEKKGRGK